MTSAPTLPQQPTDHPESLVGHFVLTRTDIDDHTHIALFIDTPAPIPPRSLLLHASFLSDDALLTNLTDAGWAFSPTFHRHYSYLPRINQSSLQRIALPRCDDPRVRFATLGVMQWKPLHFARPIEVSPLFLFKNPSSSTPTTCVLKALPRIWTA